MTPQQHACFTFLQTFIGENGFSPKYEEIARALGLKSKSGVYRLLTELSVQGKVRFGYQKARSIEIVKPGDQPPSPITPKESRMPAPNLIPVLGAAKHVVAQWRGGCLSRRDMERLEAVLKQARAA